jgi:hypothetical protein
MDPQTAHLSKEWGLRNFGLGERFDLLTAWQACILGDSRRMVRCSDCPPGTQSLLTARVWTILHTFVFLSARESLAIRLFPSHKPDRLRTETPFIQFSGCMLLIKNPVQVADVRPFAGLQKLYQGFESFSLHHAVCTAEKLGRFTLKIAGNRRNSATLALKPDRRKCPAELPSPALSPFSLEGKRAVRFQRLHQANGIRSQTDGSAKAT